MDEEQCQDVKEGGRIKRRKTAPSIKEKYQQKIDSTDLACYINGEVISNVESLIEVQQASINAPNYAVRHSSAFERAGTAA